MLVTNESLSDSPEGLRLTQTNDIQPILVFAEHSCFSVVLYSLITFIIECDLVVARDGT